MITPAVLASFEALVHDLWTWGPRTAVACHDAYGEDALKLATKRDMVLRKQVMRVQVVVLSGRGLHEFGYFKRYNYLPALDSLKATLLLRYALRQLQAEGYTEPERYTGYAPGVQNTATLRKGDETIVVVGRSQLTLRTMYNVLNHFETPEALVKPARVLFYMLAPSKGLPPGQKVIKGIATEVRQFTVDDIRAVAREL